MLVSGGGRPGRNISGKREIPSLLLYCFTGKDKHNKFDRRRLSSKGDVNQAENRLPCWLGPLCTACEFCMGALNE